MNPPGRIVRNLLYRLRLYFPTLALVSGSGEAKSGIAWCDPSDHDQQFPVHFSYMDYYPRAPWPADVLNFTNNSPGDPDPHGAHLSLVDAAGAAFARFTLQEPTPYAARVLNDRTVAAGFSWEAGFDPTLNPFGIANGIEYILQGNADYNLEKTLASPEEFIFAAVYGMHIVTEGPFDLSLAEGSGFPWNPIVFDHYDPAASANLAYLFWDAGAPLTVNGILASLPDGLPPSPRRTYTRWQLELKSPNAPSPYNVPVIFATGPIVADLIRAADWYGPYWEPATKYFYNPFVNGWTGELEFSVTVW